MPTGQHFEILSDSLDTQYGASFSETSVTIYLSIWLHTSEEINLVILFGVPQKIFDGESIPRAMEIWKQVQNTVTDVRAECRT